MTEIKLNYKRKKRAKNMLLKHDVYIQCFEWKSGADRGVFIAKH
jgi:hypothetical protein